MSEEYQGHCHCGAVKFTYQGDKIEKGLRCNCSICARKGIMMSTQTIPFDDIKIEAQEGALSMYEFGDKTAHHFYCNQCGNYTHNEPGRAPGHYRVNLACIDDIDIFQLEYDVFDGKNLL